MATGKLVITDPKFEILRNHIGVVAQSLQQHNKDLDQEVADVRAGGKQHAYARHGWQTGWESQVVRTLAGQTPDQAFNPYGFDPSIRLWGRVIVASPSGHLVGRYGLNDRGERIIDVIHPTHQRTLGDVAPQKGVSAGHFISPMAQQFAMTLAKQDVLYWGQCDSAQRRKNNVYAWHEIKRMAITSKGIKKLLGLGFSLKTGFPPRSEEESKWLIQAFENRATYKQVMDACPFSSPEARSSLRAKLDVLHSSSTQVLRALNPIAFPQLSDFFDALGLEVKSNYGVLSVWDRGTTPNAWHLVTAYAIGDNYDAIEPQAEMSVEGASGPNGPLTGTLKNKPTGNTNNTSVVNGKIVIKK